MRVLAQTILFVLLAFSCGWVQQTDKKTDEDADAEALAALFRAAPESPIRFSNRSGAPIAIEKASVRALKSDQVKLKSVCACGGAYIVLPKVTMVNNSGRRTRAVTLRFTEDQSGLDSTVRVGAIEPGASFVLNDDREPNATGHVERLSTDTSPESVTVSVFEVIYDDGLVWEAQPSTKQDNVDSEPVLVRMPAHRYTEEALKKKLEGAVKLKLLVGKDGLVKNVMVLKGLADGLNEQAVQAVYNALFKPAVRGGLPIEYWVLCELDFKLSNTGSFKRIWPLGAPSIRSL